MCGIAGTFHSNNRPADHRVLRRMISSVSHRGPDGTGTYVDGSVGLGHSRLSIIDLAGGHQPMQTSDGELTITFNGEIFNYLELRHTLQQKGYHFSTRSDTEVILHLFREYGTSCVHHMNGQWAFAIWDSRAKQLFLSRDRLGVRPLFYAWAGREFVFGSEIKAVLAHPEMRAEIDYEALHQVFRFWFPLAPRTAFAGIEQLLPGHSMVVDGQRTSVFKYWDLGFSGDEDAPDGSDKWEASLAEELKALLVDAVRIRLRADVPVAGYLSGGLDSSIITALARECVGSSLETFSIAFEEQNFDESRYQLEMAHALGTQHRTITCSPSEIGAAFKKVVWHLETPVIRTAPVPMFMLSQFVHDIGFKVVLTGEGADEFWGGYDIFKETKVRAYIAAQPESKLRPLLLRKLYPYLDGLQKQSPAYLRTFFHADQREVRDPLFSHLPRWQLTHRCHRLFSESVRSAVDKSNPWSVISDALPLGFDKWSPFRRAQYLEAAYLLPDYLLSSQGDRVAMANSVEGRYPFLDYRLAEFSARIPSRLKMKGLTEKYLLKRALGSIVPKTIVKRPKQPYRAPQANCLFDAKTGKPACEYIAEIMSPEKVREFGIFDAPSVKKLIEKAERGGAVSFIDNAALVGIFSTQSLIDQFITNPEERLAHDTYRTTATTVCH